MTRFFLHLTCIALLAGNAFAGSVEGTIRFDREVPAPKKHATGKFANICGPEIVDPSLIVNNKGLKNVVVSISGKKLKGSKDDKESGLTLDQKGCMYHPHVLTLPRESSLKILASDPTNHNIHTYSFDNDPINLMMTPGQDYVHEFEEPEVVKVECDLHKWMVAWIVVTENPYAAISGDDGKFVIKNVPPGKYTVTAWHETLGTMTQKVTVEEGSAKADFDFSKNSLQVSKK